MARGGDSSVMEAIKDASALFAESLHQFRVCHDLLQASKLFSDQEIQEMDKCAISYRELGLTTCTLARVSSDQFLDSAILYYENLEYFSESESEETTKLLIGQAGDLNKAYQVISLWATNLSEQFHKTGTGAIKESEEMVARFEAALEKALEIKQAAEEQARKSSKVCKDTGEDTGEASAKKHPSVKAASKSKAMVAMDVGHKVKEPVCEKHHLKELADQKLREANAKLEQAKSNESKAKLIASKVTDLLEVLTSLASTCYDIASYWTMESAKFLTVNQSSKALVNSAGFVSVWKKTKEDFRSYVVVMTGITNLFNFETNARLPPFQKLHFENLSLELKVPSSLDVKKIMS